jgi:hypothetical protein
MPLTFSAAFVRMIVLLGSLATPSLTRFKYFSCSSRLSATDIKSSDLGLDILDIEVSLDVRSDHTKELLIEISGGKPGK